jgi:hypothetical protein
MCGIFRRSRDSLDIQLACLMTRWEVMTVYTRHGKFVLHASSRDTSPCPPPPTITSVVQNYSFLIAPSQIRNAATPLCFNQLCILNIYLLYVVVRKLNVCQSNLCRSFGLAHAVVPISLLGLLSYRLPPYERVRTRT